MRQTYVLPVDYLHALTEAFWELFRTHASELDTTLMSISYEFRKENCLNYQLTQFSLH